MSGITELLEFLRLFIGEYVPNTQTIIIQLADGTMHEYQTIADGIASINIEYVCVFFLLITCLYIPYKLLATLLMALLGMRKSKL